MPDQDLIAADRLRQFRDDDNVCASPFERAMAAELLDARARIAELEAEKVTTGEVLDKIARAVRPDDDGMWTDRDGLLESIGDAIESTGRKVWEVDDDA